MTVIRLDAATLAKFAAAAGRVVVADESGNPVRVYQPLSPQGPDPEPVISEEQWQAILASPVKYTTEEVIEHLRGPGDR